MGDRCNIQITLRREDLARFAPHVDAAPDETWWDELHEEPGSGCVTVELFDVNYALCDPRSAAAEAGIQFYGNHSEGDEYGPAAFVSWQGEQYEAPLNHDGDLIITVDEDLEPFRDLKHLRNYVTKLKEIKAVFAAPVAETVQPKEIS